MVSRRPILRARTQSPERQADSLLEESRWFWLVLVFLILIYWLLVRYLERIDLAVPLASWWQARLPFPLPPAIVFLAELFHPRVLRHFIPVIVGWWLAYEAAVSLVRMLYDLPDRPTAQRFLSRQSSGASPGGPIALNGQTLAADREESVLLHLGGPGLVAVKNGNVAVTELNGRFCRVLGPGVHNLGRLEYVRAVLDLHQQQRSAEDVSAITKDGIDVKIPLTVTFRLNAGEASSKAQPYPYDEDTVRRAAYTETIKDDGTLTTWDQVPLGRARGILAGIIAKYRLDEILFPGTREPYHAIRQELERKLRTALADMGIELTGVHVGRLELPEPAFQQYVDYWKAHLESQIRLTLADGTASAVEEIEIARAEAEVTMIQAIIEGVRRAQYSGSRAAMREIIALRLIEALEKMARQSQELHPLPEGLLPRLSELRQQLLPDNDKPAEPEGTTKQ
ncbi:MAG TPA: SPFH domain-containing protein [Anaerolineae bacterium]